MALLISLPTEILLHILSYLYALEENFIQYGNKKNILSTRLACRRLAGIGETILFTHIKFVQDDEGFRRLSTLARSPLCQQVRVISCYFENYRTGKSSKSIVNETKFQSLVELTEKGSTGLADILSQFQNLRAIKIWQNWASSWFWDLDSHEVEALTAQPVTCRLFENVIDALATSTYSITGLALGSDRAFCPEWPLSFAAFQPRTPETRNLYQRVFGSIRQLKVMLPRIARNGIGEYGLNIRGLKALIESSPLLEDLHLSIDMGFDHEPFELDFATPKLQHLTLEGLLLKDLAAFVNFLRQCQTTLKSVEFRRLTLVQGSRVPNQKFSGESILDDTAAIKLLG